MIEGPLDADGVTLSRVMAKLSRVLMLPPAGDPCQGRAPEGVQEGIALFNQRRFYDAHEAIEHEWHAERGEIRRLYQGILQIGVGFHHALGGNYRGAILLLTDGIAKVVQFGPTCLGIETGRLARESAICLAEIVEFGPDRLGEFDRDRLPVVHFSRSA